MKKLILVFFGSLLFAATPILVAFVISLFDPTPVKGGEMNAAGEALVFAFFTIPIGLLVAIVAATRIVVSYFKRQ
jgi:hypothetical protein